jgi:antitoxin component YwqK of YwqJK toxin-antitoxin module
MLVYGQEIESTEDVVFSTVRSYYEDGTIASEINYVDNKPIGVYRFFYPDGTLMEEGVWNERHLTGNFKRYYSNGQLAQEFTYDESGNRIGSQKYFYQSGNIQAEKRMGPPEHIVVRYTKDGKQKIYVSF